MEEYFKRNVDVKSSDEKSTALSKSNTALNNSNSSYTSEVASAEVLTFHPEKDAINPKVDDEPIVRGSKFYLFQF